MSQLLENGVRTDRLTPIFSWEVLLQNSLKLSDQALMHILSLQSLNHTCNTLPEQTVIYVRSFHLTAGQLRDVAAQFRDTENAHGKIAAWVESISDLRTEEIIYIRYVGRTTRGVLRRHREDLVTRRAGFLARFLTCLEALFPTVIDSVALYTFPAPAQGSWELDNSDEICEQAVIALLGTHSLLNQTFVNAAHRGFHPKKSYRMGFKALETKTISRLLPSSFSPALQDARLAAWADDIQNYAIEHRDSVSRFRNTVHEFPDSLKHTIIRQTTPSKIYGEFVLFLTVGAGISHQAYRNQESFYDGPSDSAKLMKHSLSRLWGWELIQPIQKIYVEELVSVGALPFVDLCPWQSATGEHLEAAAGFLKRYVLITRPLIILTFSEKPSSVLAYGSPDSRKCSSRTQFWSRVGQVELVELDNLHCIQIPCFHPGQGRFSPESNIFLTVFNMTLWVLLLTISISLDSVGSCKTQTRKEWCTHIKQRVDYILRSHQFYENFNHLKSELYRDRPKSTGNALTVRQRSTIAIATRRDVVRVQFIFSGLAVDTAMSDRRRQQTYRLWELNIPELHLHISRKKPREWFLWATSLTEGDSLFVEAIAGSVWTSKTSTGQGYPRHNAKLAKTPGFGAVIDVATLPEEYRGIFSSSHPTSWVSYTDIVQAITAELDLKVPSWRLLHASRVSTEVYQAGILRFKAMYRTKLNGAEVFIWRNQSLPIYWIAPSGHKYKFVLRAPQFSLDGSLGQRKFIFFTEDGIDLRDGEGASCLVRKESLSSNNKVTFPIHHLPYCQDTAELGSRLLELWEYETGLSWINTTTAPLSSPLVAENNPVAPVHGPSFYVGEVLPLIRSNWSDSKLAPYMNPPLPADEAWLLWMCLKEHWPNGGKLFNGIAEKWPSRQDNIWVHFSDHHPKLIKVQAWARDLNYAHKTSQMIKNLEHLCTVVYQRKVQERDRARMKAEGKDVKIAGTELQIMQKW
ncbi:hypothetical protein BJX65DRAFT_320501 [Aspergillus insuetus]